MLILADIFAFIPSIRKSRDNPREETSSLYYLSAIKFVIMFAAFTNYTLITVLDI